MRRGTKNSVNFAGKCLSVIIVWCMVLSGFVGLLLVNVGTASEAGQETMAIPMIIDGENFVIENWGIYDLDGPLDIINGGSLTIINSTFNILQDDIGSPYYINVDGSGGACSLTLINSTITTGASAQISWEPFLDLTIVDSNFTMEDNSALVFPGNLNISNTLVYINDSWITGLGADLNEPYIDFPGWQQKFPTAEPALNSTWFGDLEDYKDDGPTISITNSQDVTIADSRIDMLPEDISLDTPAFLEYFRPQTIGAQDNTTNPGNDVTDLYFDDNNYYNIIENETMWIDTFNTMGYGDDLYEVTSVVVYVQYTTEGSDVSGDINWSVDGINFNTLFTPVDNSSGEIGVEVNITTDLGLGTNPTPLADLQNLDITWYNFIMGAGVSNANIEEVILNVTMDYIGLYPETQLYLNNSEVSVINSYISIDMFNKIENYNRNKVILDGDSHLYAYNMTVELDDNLDGYLDYYLDDVDHKYVDSMFIFYDTTSTAFIYKWAEIPVVDYYGNPINGTFVNATFKHTDNPPKLDWVYEANDLSSGTGDNASADARILDYMDRVSVGAIDSTNYNITNEDGTVLWPLLTTIHNKSIGDIDGDHVGEYIIDVKYQNTTGEFTGSTNVDFTPYPSIESENNVVVSPTVQLNDVMLPFPDLTPGTITFFPDYPDVFIGDTVMINATIENIGGTNALDVLVEMYDWYMGSPTLIGSTNISSIPAGGNVVWQVNWDALEGEQHAIEVVIDFNNTITEGNESNNANDPYEGIYVTPYLPELVISPTDISFTPTIISYGNTVTIEAQIHNQGYADASSVEVRFYSQNPDVSPADYIEDTGATSYLIGSNIIDIGWNPSTMDEIVTTSIDWIPPSDGIYSIYVWIDTFNTIVEYEEQTNNIAYWDLTVTPRPNLLITPDNITFSDETPMINQPIDITVNVTNVGGLNINGTTTFDVEFRDNGNLIGTQSITDLNISETKSVTQPWTPTTKLYHAIQVIVDTTAVVAETDETDNLADVEILVYDGGVFDLIVNDTLPLASPGTFTIDGPYIQHGYVLVEESGVLNIANSNLIFSQTSPNQFNIIVKDNGILNIDTSNIDTGSFPMDIFVRGNAELNIMNTNTPDQLNMIAEDSALLNIDESDIAGSISASGNVALEVVNSTLRTSLEDLSGNTRANLTGVVMTSPIIAPLDNAEVYIYRWINVAVLDANYYPIPNANVNLSYVVPNYLQSGLYQDKTTDANGEVLFSTLSDIINSTVYPDSASVSNYRLTSSFLTFSTELGIGLPYYPAMTIDDAYIEETIIMDQVRPDMDPPLYVSNYAPNRNEPVMIYTEVSNTGDVIAHNVLVQFADNGIVFDNTYITELLPAQTVNISVGRVWSLASDIGQHNITVTVDPDNTTKELDETNNHNWTIVNVVGRPDLAISGGINMESEVTVDVDVPIAVSVSNTGTIDANNVEVRFYDAEMNGTLIGNYTFATIAVGEILSTPSIYWTPTAAGEYTIYVIIDEANTIAEIDETNNDANTTVTATLPADLRISGDINVANEVIVNTDVLLTVWVNNAGTIDVSNVVVSFYDAEVNGTLIGNYTFASIAVGETLPTTSVYWTPTSTGIFTIYAVIDENNTIAEFDETNNDANATVTVNLPANLIISSLEFLVDDIDVSQVANRTMVTLRVVVENTGGTDAITVYVDFEEGAQYLGTERINYIASGGNDTAEITWFASADELNGANPVTRSITVSARSGTYYSPDHSESIIITDSRPDLTATSTDANVTTDPLIESSPFEVNVTIHNDGADAASNFTVEIFYDEVIEANLIGTAVVEILAGNSEMGVLVTTTGIPVIGDHYLFIVIDREITVGDNFTVYGMNYNLTGNVEEFNEANNDLINVTVNILAPDYQITIYSPGSGQNYTIGEENNTFVSGQITKVVGRQGVAGVEITIIIDGNTFTAISDANGNFNTAVDLPITVGQYTVVATNPNADDASTIININSDTTTPWFWIIVMIIIAVVAIVGAITAYLYFVGLGKTVECGECGAFIPESASKCPKCNTEFETDTAKCSVCGAWVPMNSKTCPECSSEFTIGDEEIDDYKAQMKKQYDDVVNGFRTEAKKELGDSFSEEDFQAWWATQATFVTFDQWLKEDEEMKRLGSKPCPNCGTPNSVTATICHKCGTVMEESTEPAEPVHKPEPTSKSEAVTKKVVKASPAAAATVAATEKKSESTREAEETKAKEETEQKKKCPSCGMELAMHEKSCPICSYDFEQQGDKSKDEKPPEGGAPKQVTKKVVRKPVKKVVRRPVQKKGPEGDGQ